MTEFRTPIDIANRGLQHCGSERIDPTYGFEEESKRASECAFVYGKLRQAELRRNLWRFAIKFAVLRPVETTSRLIAPALWDGTAVYQVAELCTDVGGSVWISTEANNRNRPPGYAEGWEMYFGPLAIPPWDSTEEYFAGDVVYVAAGDGTYSTYYSLTGSNTSNPATAVAWAATTTYTKGDLVSVSGTPYVSLIDLNLNQDPATTAVAAWSSATTYSVAQKAMGSDGYTYSSVGGSNTGNDPTLDFNQTFWTRGALTAWSTITGRRGTGSTNWQPLTAVLKDLRILSPVSAYPGGDSRSLYRLPANYLRMAPQNPKMGSVHPLGAPSADRYRDWDLQGMYFTTMDTGAIVLRFGADYVDVATMDPLFCEGLAARIGYEVCEPLTQDKQKKQQIASGYQKFMSEARIVNAIETGPVEPPEDDWVACRR